MPIRPFHKNDRGFTLVEILVGTAIFVIVAIAVYGSFTSLVQLANGSQARTLAVHLATEQFEIVRNLPYANVGLTDGIPQGVLSRDQVVTRGGVTFNVHLTVRNINLSGSVVQASDKLIEVAVNCPACQKFQPIVLTGQISPANLQSAGNGGAVVSQVFNGSGEPVQGATVYLQSVATSSVSNTDITNNAGILNVIGVPPGVNMYKIVASKAGYSTDQTYALGSPGNPNPIKPNITVLDQEVSSASFAIDKLSSLRFSSVSPLCVPVADFDFNLAGAKQIGFNLPKYSQNVSTNSSGILNLSDMEWDTYTITPTDLTHEVAGINPFSPFALNPDNSQNVQLVVVPKSSNSLMVSVSDSTTGLPLSGVLVELIKPGFSESKITGQGYISQTDWSGGPGQDLFADPAGYFGDNGLVDVATSSGNIVMKDIFGFYSVATGTLESSTFDTGTTSNYHIFSWNPLNQPLLAGNNSVKFQFAANVSPSSAWDYIGPDGTADSYYDVPDMAINALNSGKRFVRYKAYLRTETATVTPIVSDVSFAYTSSCLPPGQVLFQGISTDTHSLNVSKAGYSSQTIEIAISPGWQEKIISLSEI